MKVKLLLAILCLNYLCFAQVIGGSGSIGGNGTIGGGASGAATLSFVSPGAQTPTCYGTTSCAITYTPSNGNLLRVDIECSDTVASDPPGLTTDNGTSSWVNGCASGHVIGPGYYLNEDYTLAVAGSPTTITVHCGASATGVTGSLTEYHRTSGSWTFGGCAGSPWTATGGSGATATAASVTPTSGVPALISGYFDSIPGNTWSSSGSFTVRTNQEDLTQGNVYGTADQIVSSASGSYSPTAAQTSGSWDAWSSWYK